MIRKLAFSVTHDCPICCKYCVTRSGPNRGPSLDTEFMTATIAAVMRLAPLGVVVFTGGEALLRRQDVEETIRFASAHRLWTRIVTNGYWASTPEVARRVMRDLADAGLSEINVSADDLHQEHLPVENVRNAFWAAKDCGIPVLIAHKRVAHARVTPEYLSEVLGVALEEYRPGEEPREGASYLYSSSLTVPIGTGADALDPDDYILYPDGPGAWTGPCGAVLDGLVVSPTRDLHICCGMMEQSVPELSVGRCVPDRMAELLYEANTDLIANWLALEGPYGLMRFIQTKSPSIRFGDRYVNDCHLCNEILTRPECREVLAAHADEKAAEISLRRGLLEALRYEDERTADSQATTAPG